jgi:penicillin-binding protein 1A
MWGALRALGRGLELMLWWPVTLVQRLLFAITAMPNLGPLRHLVSFALAYTIFALLLVYAVAPVRGVVGHYFLGDKLRYDAERWMATAIYDRAGGFVGTFDPRLDSQRDVNYTESEIALGDYVANPDHKSIPVREMPEHYWQCLVYHEDRYLGTALNPFGIDLMGVLKIPYTTLTRSIATHRPTLGIGGSTLPMQFVRVIYNTPPSAAESGATKLRRKFREWWLAPVIYRELTRGGDITPMKQWAANHIWLAQRTGGAPLHGVEITSRVVFGREAKDLTVAQQFVLASAVNKPIILLTGNDKLNEVRLDRWRYIAQVRARICAEKLIADPKLQKDVLFELTSLAQGPPDPRVKPKLQEALEHYAPALAKRAAANPMIRANALLPAARFGLREEMKQAYGLGWRAHVRGLTTTIDAVENLAFQERVTKVLAEIEAKHVQRFASGYTLDPQRLKAGGDLRMPDVIIAAANARGEIVRYYEASETAAYFGSPFAREAGSGAYVPSREPRMIASTGKILAAIAIANGGKDGPGTLYLDRAAPAHGSLEGCEKGAGTPARGRKAIVAFACSLNQPLEWRLAQLGQGRVQRLVDRFGFNMPPAASAEEATPASTATVRGLVAGAPRRVHQMAGVVLGALTGEGHRPVPMPSLIRAYDFPEAGQRAPVPEAAMQPIVPNRVIADAGRPLLKALLQAPLCHTVGGQPAGTLKGLAHWCADRRSDLRLHFAKTGTSVSSDVNATVDTWIAGGLQFASGQAYSYVVLVGTGSPSKSWARSLHAAQVAQPLAEALLEDLKSVGRGGKRTVADATGRALPQGR